MANAAGTHSVFDRVNRLRAEQRAIIDDSCYRLGEGARFHELEARLIDVQSSLSAIFATPEYEDAITPSHSQCGNDWGGF